MNALRSKLESSISEQKELSQRVIQIQNAVSEKTKLNFEQQNQLNEILRIIKEANFQKELLEKKDRELNAQIDDTRKILATQEKNLKETRQVLNDTESLIIMHQKNIKEANDKINDLENQVIKRQKITAIKEELDRKLNQRIKKLKDDKERLLQERYRAEQERKRRVLEISNIDSVINITTISHSKNFSNAESNRLIIQSIRPSLLEKRAELTSIELRVQKVETQTKNQELIIKGKNLNVLETTRNIENIEQKKNELSSRLKELNRGQVSIETEQSKATQALRVKELSKSRLINEYENAKIEKESNIKGYLDTEKCMSAAMEEIVPVMQKIRENNYAISIIRETEDQTYMKMTFNTKIIKEICSQVKEIDLELENTRKVEFSKDNQSKNSANQ